MTEPTGRVLLVGNGESHQVGAFFRKALQDLGLPHAFHDESPYFTPRSRALVHRALFRVIGARRARERYNRDLLALAARFRPTAVIVSKGAFVRPSVLSEIKGTTGATVLNYATDDPFNPVNSTPELVASIPCYDVYATTKRAIAGDLRAAGAQRVVWVPFGYEPSLHHPEAPANEAERERWSSDVVFIGGADRDRVPFFLPLAGEPGLRLRLHGGYWGRYRGLRAAWDGFVLGRDFRLALGGSKIAPCLVRRGNRDGHVMRTFEVPACGAFLLAERSDEHLELFDEGREMACFESPEELLDKVRYYLAHDDDRRRMAEAGYRRVTAGQHTYRDRMVELLRHVAEVRT
jgi:hypothetical protein